MSNGERCHCQCCTIHGMMGAAIVITIGVLFLLHQVPGGYFDFSNTWPVILLVIGALKLASALSSREGHVERTAPGAVPPAPPVPPASTPTSPYSSQGQ